MRILFIGQAPSRESDGKPPFTGKCGIFLANLMGKTQDQMLQDHDFLNVLDRWPGKGIGGDKFPMVEATIRAKNLFPAMRGKIVVLLGANVARAFNLKSFTYYESHKVLDPENTADVLSPLCCVMPHPSGVNRHWNHLENRLRAQEFLSNIIGLSQKPEHFVTNHDRIKLENEKHQPSN